MATLRTTFWWVYRIKIENLGFLIGDCSPSEEPICEPSRKKIDIETCLRGVLSNQSVNHSINHNRFEQFLNVTFYSKDIAFSYHTPPRHRHYFTTPHNKILSYPRKYFFNRNITARNKIIDWNHKTPHPVEFTSDHIRRLLYSIDNRVSVQKLFLHRLSNDSTIMPNDCSFTIPFFMFDSRRYQMLIFNFDSLTLIFLQKILFYYE